MKNIIIVGAGNIGSRHLQALKAVNHPLNICVVDPNQNSLKIAKGRYKSVKFGHYQHEINFSQKIVKSRDEIDIAIVATSSNVRREVIERLLKLNKVKFLILEKILFQKRKDYNIIDKILKESNCQTWVNCSLREMPAYKNQIRNSFKKKNLLFSVSGSEWGLMCNSLHFIDYISYLIECNDFIVDTTYLDRNLIPSNRKGFSELTGILQIHFKDGSHGILACYPSGKLPLIFEITSDTSKYSIEVVKGDVNIIIGGDEHGWRAFKAEYIHVSKLSTLIVEKILNKGKCALPTYNDSMKMHLALFEPILDFINQFSKKKFSYYPFT